MTGPNVDLECSPEISAFIAWLSGLMKENGVTRHALGIYLELGASGRRQIDNDLSRAYLPEWQYVVSTYLGPVQSISGKPLAADAIGVGKSLYDAAAPMTAPYSPSPRAHDSYARIVAPVMAGFSLPAIVTLATSATPGQPYRDIALGCFIAATGLFLGSIQLTIGGVYVYAYKWGWLRALLTFGGIVLLVTALIVLVAAATEHWWIDLALAALGLGGAMQAVRPFFRWLRPSD